MCLSLHPIIMWLSRPLSQQTQERLVLRQIEKLATETPPACYTRVNMDAFMTRERIKTSNEDVLTMKNIQQQYE
jgi:hypothetical protein